LGTALQKVLAGQDMPRQGLLHATPLHWPAAVRGLRAQFMPGQAAELAQRLRQVKPVVQLTPVGVVMVVGVQQLPVGQDTEEQGLPARRGEG
jgi:hypothetical protein